MDSGDNCPYMREHRSFYQDKVGTKASVEFDRVTYWTLDKISTEPFSIAWGAYSRFRSILRRRIVRVRWFGILPTSICRM
jgi:hypothetical protein